MNNNQFAPSYYAYPDNADIYQQRLNNMAQQQNQQNNMFNGYQQQPQGVQMPFMYGNNTMMPNVAQQPRYNVRPVSGIDEVYASPAPCDGSISVFTDFSHGRIYTKQLNMNDGNALMRTYQRIENPKQSESTNDGDEFVKKSEFAEFKDKVNEVWNALTEPASNDKDASKEKE